MKKKLFAFVSAAFVLSCGCFFAAENPQAAQYQAYRTENENAPVVYFIREVTPEALVKVYDAMGWTPEGKVGVKISTGEPPASNYLRPELIGDLVQKVDGVIVESNTSYGGRRASNALHHQVVKDHGFLDIAEFDLLDEEGTMDIPVGPAAVRLERNIVGSHFDDYDSYLVLSHFKGHAMAGFGGAIKNLSIGFGSGQSAPESGKVYIHTGGERTRGNIYGEQIPFLEAMAEAAQAVCNYMDGGKNTAFVNVLNRLSVDCDCNGNPAEPDMHDIGILASTDPLAIDQAAIDLVFTAPDSASLVERIDSRQGRHVLEHAQAIGLGAGTRSYRLVEIE